MNVERIRKIAVVNAGISDLSALRQLPDLTYLQLFFNLDIGNLEPLRNLTELTYLDLSANGVKDISALSGLKKLTYLGHHQRSNAVVRTEKPDGTESGF